MARLIQSSDGNFTGTVWSACVTALSGSAEIDVETAQAVSNSNINSQQFVLPATEIDGIALKLAQNTQPATTLTVTLRNATTATDDRAVTVNMTDLPLADTTFRQGGWMFFKFSSPITPNGTDSFLVRAIRSGSTGTVQFWRDGTVGNFSRFIRSTATTAPAAADLFICTRELTGAGTGNNRALTMDNTGSTTYGNATGLSTIGLNGGGAVNAAFCVGHGATVTWGTAAATNYLLKLTGSLLVYSGGTWVQGASGAEIPRDSTAILEFVMTTSGDSKIGIMGANNIAGSSVFRAHGLSRSPALDVTWCLLDADEAAAQTTLSVDRETGWLDGDEIAIASTTRTASQAEKRILDVNASATELTVTVGLTNAHGGGDADPDVVAEVILLSRNVIIRSDNAARGFGILAQPAATVSLSWMRLQHDGFGSSNIETTTGSYTADYVATVDSILSAPVYSIPTGGTTNFHIRHCVNYHDTNNVWISTAVMTTSTWSIFDCVSVRAGNTCISAGWTVSGEVHDLRISGAVQVGITIGASAGTVLASDFATIVCHSNGNAGIQLTSNVQNRVITGLKMWRNSQLNNITTIGIGTLLDLVIDGGVFFGNSGTNINTNATFGNVLWRNCIIAGDTSFSTNTGISLTNPNITGLTKHRFENCIFGGGGGVKTTHASQDVIFGTALTLFEAIFVGTSLLSGTRITNNSELLGCRLSELAPQETLADSYTTLAGRGTIAYNTSVVDAPHTVSEHLIPNTTLAPLQSSPVTVKVSSGVAPTVEARVRYTASYNGAFKPRMVLKANAAVGIDADVIVDTAPNASADAWLTIGDALPTPSANGKLQLVIEVDGTGDGAYVSAWSSGSEAVEPEFWFEGLTGGEMSAASGGGGGGGETSHGSFG